MLIDFLLAFDRRPAELRPSPDAGQALGRNCIVTPTLQTLWRAALCPALTVYAWGHDVLPIDAVDRVRETPDGLSIFNGWMLPRLGARPLADADAAAAHLESGAPGYGEFLVLGVDRHGNGAIARNLLASVQLYQHRASELVLIGTRPSIIAGYLGGSGLNADFARWVANYSVPMTADSLFAGIAAIPAGSAIALERGLPLVHEPSGNILASEALLLGYQRDPDAYWDAVFENLIGLMSVVDATDIDMEFPLSGGKDSRLMLGLLIAAGRGERIAGVYTNGPEESPEVRSARAVADHLGLPHSAVNRTTQTPAPITPQLPVHLFVTEGEMSPIDLTTRVKPRRHLQLSGQESGLRNIAGKRDVSTRDLLRQWLMVTVGRGDFCHIMTEEAAEQNRADVDGFIERNERLGVPYEQMPTKHRVDHRGARWVSRVWGAGNATEFSPHIFRSEVVTLATYNAGARSRQLEEFHFQMLKRIDRALLRLPFAGQSWDPELIALLGEDESPPAPLNWPAGSTPFSQRTMFGVLRAHFEPLKQFVAAHAGEALRGVIDIDRLHALEADWLRPGHVQPLWQVFQCALLESVGDFGALRTLPAADLGIPDFDQKPA